MNTQDIFYFITVCEAGSFSKAARSLYITPQGLSKSIRSLEEELGVTLLKRNSKGITLTDKGRTFLETAKGIYPQLYALEHLFDGEIDSTKGRITISASLGILASLTPEYLLSFNEKYPNVTIVIKEKSDCFVDKDMQDNKADIGLVKLPVKAEGVEIFPIDTKRHCALVYKGHPLYQKEKISINDLRNEKIIIENSDFKVYGKFLELCRGCGFEPEIYFETTEISMAHSLAHLKKGIAITVEAEMERIGYDDLKPVFFEEEFLCQWAIAVRRDMNSITKAFLNHLRNA